MQNEENDLRDRTKAFALQIIRMFTAMPKTTEAQVLGKQLLRSGTSVGANYREAYRGRSKAEWSDRDERHARQRREGSGSEPGRRTNEFISKCGDSLRELEERSVPGTVTWMVKPARATGEVQGVQRIKLLTGLNCSPTQTLSQEQNFQIFDGNATN
jgi:hypothetical protein